jgi:hypothetical protein
VGLEVVEHVGEIWGAGAGVGRGSPSEIAGGAMPMRNLGSRGIDARRAEAGQNHHCGRLQ